MDKIRVWEVTTDSSEWFDTLDLAVAYLRAEVKAGKPAGRIESHLVEPEEYVRLTDGHQTEVGE